MTSKNQSGLNQKQLDQVSAVVAKIVLEYLDKEKQRRQKMRKDWRRRNTKLLLKHYRGMVAHTEDSDDKVSMIDMTEVMDELNSEDFAVESIKKSKRRTRAMVQFVQRMMRVYQIGCELTGKAEDMRRYKTINALFISEELSTVEDIAKLQNIDPRTVYIDVNEACKALSVLVFGVDAIHFE